METIQDLPVTSIQPDPDQPRRSFDDAALGQLMESMSSEGLQSPIQVRPLEAGGFQIVAGERRWRAAKTLGWPTIPAIVRVTDLQVAQRAQVLENIVRRDLTPIETARAFRKLLDGGMTTAQVAHVVGRQPGDITWYVNLLRCRDEILQLVDRGHMQPTLAWHIGRLSPDGQLRALSFLTSHKLSLADAVQECERRLGEEQQGRLPGTDGNGGHVVEVQNRSVGRALARALEELAKVLAAEERTPGALAQLEAQAPLTKLQVAELRRLLGKLPLDV